MTIVHDQSFVDPSPPARRLLWQILAIGSTARDEPESFRGRDKAGVLLFWVTSGQGRLLADRTYWDIHPGSACWLVDMSRARTFTPTSQWMSISGMRLNGPNLDSWSKLLGVPGEFRFPSQTGITRLQRLHGRLTELVKHRPANFEWQVHESVTQVVGNLLAIRKVLSRATEVSAPPRPVTRVLQAVLSNPVRGWRAAELAEVAGISYSGLRSLFRESQHESLSEFLRRVRLDRARSMLLDDRMAIKEIARELRFSSEFYFSQWFHRLSGTSPSRFRQEHLEK